MRSPATFRPEKRSLDRAPVLGRRRIEWRADIEHHRDVGTEVLLDPDRLFRRQLQEVAVYVGAEDGPLVVDLEIGCETEDLEAAGVGENRPIPVHEAMEAAEFGDDGIAGAEGEVIGVSKDNT